MKVEEESLEGFFETGFRAGSQFTFVIRSQTGA